MASHSPISCPNSPKIESMRQPSIRNPAIKHVFQTLMVHGLIREKCSALVLSLHLRLEGALRGA